MTAKIDYESRAKRIEEAINDGNAKQVEIADYCQCSEQAVTRWKTTGKITNENRFMLSEMTGFRYLYLRNGELPKHVSTWEENKKDYIKCGDAKLPHFDTGSAVKSSCEAEDLIAKIRIADKAKALTPQAIEILSSLVDELRK